MANEGGDGAKKSVSIAHLQHFFIQPRLLRQHLELPGVWVLVDLEVGLHNPQLVVLERGSGTFCFSLAEPVAVHSRGIPLNNFVLQFFEIMQFSKNKK